MCKSPPRNRRSLCILPTSPSLYNLTLLPLIVVCNCLFARVFLPKTRVLLLLAMFNVVLSPQGDLCRLQCVVIIRVIRVIRVINAVCGRVDTYFQLLSAVSITIHNKYILATVQTFTLQVCGLYIHTCIHTCHIHTHIHTYRHIYTHIHTYSYTYTRIHIHTLIHICLLDTGLAKSFFSVHSQFIHRT